MIGTITITISLLIVGLLVPTLDTRASTDNDDESRGTCREMGYKHGQNGDFDHGIFNDGCDDVYYDGFIDGCMNAGNTRDVCESATDE